MKISKSIQIYDTYQNITVLINTKSNKVYKINSTTKMLIKVLKKASTVKEIEKAVLYLNQHNKKDWGIIIDKIIKEGVFEIEQSN